MSLTCIAFLIIYVAFAVACLAFHPRYGAIGYYATYIISPGTSWWGMPLAQRGFRFSQFMAFITILGLIIHLRRLRFRNIVTNQEICLFLFIVTVWIAGLLNPAPFGEDNQATKLTKAALMILALRFSIDDLRSFRYLIWALLLASAWGAFDTRLLANRVGSRIHIGSGGSDFLEGNFLAAHLAALLPLLGILILEGRMHIKIFLTAISAIIVDTIIQCRSRGAFIAIMGGTACAIAFAPKGIRRNVFLLILAGIMGSLVLIDADFWRRMHTIDFATTITEQDSSSAGRLLAWRTAIAMASDHPMGVGYNNFKHFAGNYEPSILGKDTHNTYLRCLAELGIQGTILLSLLILNALLQSFRLLRTPRLNSDSPAFAIMSYALCLSLSIYLLAGVFISLTFIEDFYLIIMLPGILQRCHLLANNKDAPSMLQL
jgi:O-antigen ligase